jgi:hypothetical protein
MLVDLLAKYLTAEQKREHRERLLSQNTKKTAKGKTPNEMGKSLVPAKKSFLGKLFGKKEPEQEESAPPTQAEQTLGEIYKMMKLMEEDKRLNQELVNNHIEEEETKKDQRNEEIIKALTARTPKGKKGDRAKRRAEEKKVKEPKVEKKPKETAPTKTTTPANPPAPTTKPAVGVTARQVAGAAIVGAGVVGMSSAIGGAESGGNYDISFGDRVDKTGKITNKNGFETAETRFGKKLTELTLAQVDELGKARNRKSANSSAMGKYQFMNTTLFGRNVIDKNTGKTVHTPGLVEQLGLPMDTKFSPEVQDKLNDLLARQDAAALQRQGIPLTPGYQYMAHYIGAGGAGSVYKAVKAGKDMTVAQAMVADGKGDPSNNNRELAQIKVKDFEKILEGRLNKHGLSTPHASYDQTTETLDKKSVENKNLKQEAAAQQQKVNKDTTNNFVTSKQKQGQEETKKEDDSPVIIKKNR